MATPAWALAGNVLGTAGTNDFLGTTDAQPLVIKTGAVERVRVDTNGNVGMGTSTPGSRLHVNVAASPNPVSAMTIDVQSFETMPNAQASHFLLVHDIGAAPPNGATHFAIRGNGYVGIGTPQPSARLSVTLPNTSEIAGSAKSNTLLTSSGGLGAPLNSEVALASFGFDADNLNNVSLGVRAIRASQSQQGWPSTAIGLGMDVDNTVRAGAALFLNANGNVGVGTPTPALKVDVNGDIGVNGVDAIRRDSNNAYIFPFGTQTANNNVVIGGGPGGNTSLQVTGNVSVGGDVILTGADCAEQFDVNTASSMPEPGTVLVIDPSGALAESSEAYDKKVAGVVSGAGAYRPGILLDRQPESKDRASVALLGKVYCKVDARYGTVDVGDLLTTSPTAGHAMKASDPIKAFGCVIGKALEPLTQGKGLIPILVALQ